VRYLSNGQTKINQIVRKSLAHITAQNEENMVSKCLGGGPGEAPPENKMNVENLKSDKNI